MLIVCTFRTYCVCIQLLFGREGLSALEGQHIHLWPVRVGMCAGICVSICVRVSMRMCANCLAACKESPLLLEAGVRDYRDSTNALAVL